MIDFITKGMQSFEMNAYLLLICPININIIINVNCTNIKTAFFGQILCESKEFLGKSLIIGVSNDIKRKEKLRFYLFSPKTM